MFNEMQPNYIIALSQKNFEIETFGKSGEPLARSFFYFAGYSGQRARSTCFLERGPVRVKQSFLLTYKGKEPKKVSQLWDTSNSDSAFKIKDYEDHKRIKLPCIATRHCPAATLLTSSHIQDYGGFSGFCKLQRIATINQLQMQTSYFKLRCLSKTLRTYVTKSFQHMVSPRKRGVTNLLVVRQSSLLDQRYFFLWRQVLYCRRSLISTALLYRLMKDIYSLLLVTSYQRVNFKNSWQSLAINLLKTKDPKHFHIKSSFSDFDITLLLFKSLFRTSLARKELIRTHKFYQKSKSLLHLTKVLNAQRYNRSYRLQKKSWYSNSYTIEANFLKVLNILAKLLKQISSQSYRRNEDQNTLYFPNFWLLSKPSHVFNKKKNLVQSNILKFSFDLIDQRTIRFLLEILFESQNYSSFHGIRPGISPHLCLKYIQREFADTNWFIVGNLSNKFTEVKASNFSLIFLISDFLRWDFIRNFFPSEPSLRCKSSFGAKATWRKAENNQKPVVGIFSQQTCPQVADWPLVTLGTKVTLVKQVKLDNFIVRLKRILFAFRQPITTVDDVDNGHNLDGFVKLCYLSTKKIRVKRNHLAKLYPLKRTISCLDSFFKQGFRQETHSIKKSSLSEQFMLSKKTYSWLECAKVMPKVLTLDYQNQSMNKVNEITFWYAYSSRGFKDEAPKIYVILRKKAKVSHLFQQVSSFDSFLKEVPNLQKKPAGSVACRQPSTKSIHALNQVTLVSASAFTKVTFGYLRYSNFFILAFFSKHGFQRKKIKYLITLFLEKNSFGTIGSYSQASKGCRQAMFSSKTKVPFLGYLIENRSLSRKSTLHKNLHVVGDNLVQNNSFTHSNQRQKLLLQLTSQKLLTYRGCRQASSQRFPPGCFSNETIYLPKVFLPETFLKKLTCFSKKKGSYLPRYTSVQQLWLKQPFAKYFTSRFVSCKIAKIDVLKPYEKMWSCNRNTSDKNFFYHMLPGVNVVCEAKKSLPKLTSSKTLEKVNFKKKKNSSSKIRLLVNMQKVIQSLSDKGFCDRSGNPKPNFLYFKESQKNTVGRVASILRGLTNYYQLAESKRRNVTRWSYILTHSIAMMFAAKFKLSTRAKVFALAGRNLMKPLLAKKRKTRC